jgi:hypothetical protein
MMLTVAPIAPNKEYRNQFQGEEGFVMLAVVSIASNDE